MRGLAKVVASSLVALVLSTLSSIAWAHPGHIEGLMGEAMHFMLDWGYLLVMVLGALVVLRVAKRSKSQREDTPKYKKIMPPDDRR
ncbi:MAG: hypothetical protein WCK56_04980 [Alcaligenaceae bacterium]